MKYTRNIIGLAVVTMSLLQWAAGQDVAPSVTEVPPAVSEEDFSDEVVETVQLGGEENVSADQEGVQRAGDYDYTPNVDSPFDGETGTVVGKEEETPVTDQMPSENDPSRIAYPVTRRNARTMSLTVPAPRGLITDRNG
ncbi:MAG: hypothetical protein IKV92_08475, partial [Akkermansia sp.]|nr:hypothetical protein [Akkermansia sp.]